MSAAGETGSGVADPAEYQRRCSFDQVALDAARKMEAIFKSSPLYLRVTKAQIAITDLLMTETAHVRRLRIELAAASAERDAAVARVAELEAALRPVVARAAHLEPDWLDDECHWHPAVGSPLTVGHLRAAARALQPGSPS